MSAERKTQAERIAELRKAIRAGCIVASDTRAAQLLELDRQQAERDARAES